MCPSLGLRAKILTTHKLESYLLCEVTAIRLAPSSGPSGLADRHVRLIHHQV